MLGNIRKKVVEIKDFEGGKVLNCIIRAKQIKVTPEEIVRQRVVKCLLEDMLVPAHNIEVEYYLGKKEKGRQTRADIVVFNNKKPLITIECKNENIDLGINEFEQACEYDNTLKSGFVVVTNGRQVRLYKKNEGVFTRVKNSYFTYGELCEGLKLDPLSFRSKGTQMANFIAVVRAQIVNNEAWKTRAYLLDSMPVLTFAYLHFDLFQNIDNSFLDTWNIPSKLGKYKKDLGLFERRMTNAGGGSRIELQRSFEFIDDSNQVRIINFSYRSQMERTPKPKGFYQVITCGMDTNKSATVQIQLMKNVKVIKENKVKLIHNGVMSRIKSAEVIAYVKQRCPYLLEGDVVNLGEFSIEHKIWDKEDENIKDHIGRFFDYAICREEFKKLKGINSK